jgi:hypothetical protein
MAWKVFGICNELAVAVGAGMNGEEAFLELSVRKLLASRPLAAAVSVAY